MLAHHLMFNPEKQWVDMPPLTRCFPNLIGGLSIDNAVGSFGQICVSLFMFLGGYGLAASISKGEFSLLDKIIRLYKTYWRYFIVFVPIGFLFFSKQDDYLLRTDFCHVFSDFNLKQMISSFVGWTFDYNKEWWFLRAYVVYIILTYIYIRRMCDCGNAWKEFAVVLLINILLTGVLPSIGNIEALTPIYKHKILSMLYLYDNAACGCCSIMGAFSYKHTVLENLKSELFSNRFSIMSSITCMIIIFYMRILVVGKVFDIFYVPFFITSVWVLSSYFLKVSSFIAVLGKYSSGMWLTHSFYLWYYEPFCKFIFGFGNLWISLVVLIAISCLTAIIMDNFPRVIKRYYADYFVGEK